MTFVSALVTFWSFAFLSCGYSAEFVTAMMTVLA